MATPQQLSNLMLLFRGGVGNTTPNFRTQGPYENEKNMFANKIITPPGARLPRTGPIPPPRPDPMRTGSTGGAVDPRIANATSTSSVMGSPYPSQVANATSPSSLIQSPPQPSQPNPLQAAVDAAPYTGAPRGAIPYHGPFPGAPGGGASASGPGYSTFADSVRGFEKSMGQPAPGTVDQNTPNTQTTPNPAYGPQPGGLMGLLLRAWRGAL